MKRTPKSEKTHVPVLLEGVVTAVAPLNEIDGLFIDGTFGRGGHSMALLEAYSKLRILGLDCDHEALEYAKATYSDIMKSERLEVARANFSDFDVPLAGRKLNGVLLDLGVSSPQLDQGHRGFSFYHDGPLDMRMDHTRQETAADIVNTWDEESLIELFKTYGEIYHSPKVVSRIIEKRKEKLFTTTGELAKLIESADGWRIKGVHPATNYFMALRIQVNQELARLEKVLPKFLESLVHSGRILVITFHSLEDRIVKETFRAFEDNGLGVRVNKNVIQAEWAEKKANPRARSAKLRVFEKGTLKRKRNKYEQTAD